MRNAKSRWDEEYASLKRSALLQGQIADQLGADTCLLDDAMARSRFASGALDVTQVSNELTALGVKQSLQLQSLLAAHARTETLGRARDLAIEDEACQRFQTFVGNPPKSIRRTPTDHDSLIVESLLRQGEAQLPRFRN